MYNQLLTPATFNGLSPFLFSQMESTIPPDTDLNFDINFDNLNLPPKIVTLQDGLEKPVIIVLDSPTPKKAMEILAAQDYPDEYEKYLKQAYYPTIVLGRLLDGTIAGYRVISDTIPATMQRQTFYFTRAHSRWHDEPLKKIKGLWAAMAAYFLEEYRFVWKDREDRDLIAENIAPGILHKFRAYSGITSAQLSGNIFANTGLLKYEVPILLSLFTFTPLPSK